MCEECSYGETVEFTVMEIERECLFILFIYWLIIVYNCYDIEKKFNVPLSILTT